MRKSEYKILSFSTTMRNPQRIAELCYEFGFNFIWYNANFESYKVEFKE